jgi:hypothetical protein
MSTVDSRRELLKQIKERKYLNRDFDGFYQDLRSHAQTYFPDKIKDLSENGVGGLLLEMPAYVGDVMSFYLDHQFHELNAETAVEPKNIETHLKDSDVEIVGAAPAVSILEFFIKVPAEVKNLVFKPQTNSLPIIHAGTTVKAENGVLFELVDDINFNDTDSSGNLKAKIVVGDTEATTGNPTTFILSKKEIGISGLRASETFSVGSFTAFKTFTLSKENITEIISVSDDLGNEYHQVDFLTQDTVWKAITNKSETDNTLVKDNLELIPAPYRFTKSTSLTTRLTTLTFGGGSASSLTDDIIPDPSEFAVPLYGKRIFSRFNINPNNLLNTSTLGIIAPNTNITITYRYGGGLSHNVVKNSIKNIETLTITFPNSPSTSIASFVRNSIDANNPEDASGGDDAPTLDELKLRIPAAKASQGNMTTKEDLLARIYKMPSNFGRVFRAAVKPDPTNPLASRLHVVCRDINGNLCNAPDALKKNLATYLNQHRLISDAIDILDVPVVNFKIEFRVVANPEQSNNKQLILQTCLKKLANYFNIKKFEIDQPINVEHVRNILFNTPGILGVENIRITNITGTFSDRKYSDVQFDIETNIFHGLLIGPAGSMFELKYKDYDLLGSII